MMDRPRVAMFVLNPVRFDRRVLREAATLAESGCEVTIYGVADESTEISREAHPDGFAIVRVPMPGRSSLWPAGRNPPQPEDRPPTPRFTRVPVSHARWLLNARRRWWAWGRAVVAQAQPADVYHGHDLPGLGVAVAARHRHGGRLVYDSHDLFLEAGANATRPRAIRRLIRHIEGRWVRQADLVVTVNGEIAARLKEMYSVRELAVVHNCVPRWKPAKNDDALRHMSGVPAGSRIVLYHGGFTANRGLGLLMRALLQPGLEEAHLVMLGYGPMEDELRRLATAESYGGRVHILDPVPPDQLDRLVACADVAAMVNQPSSVNEVLSTPNKLFESIAAGVPIVTSDFPIRRSIVLDNPTGPLGAVCDPTQPTEIAHALLEILSLPTDEHDAMRRRCLRAAHDRWNWEHEAAQLVIAYRGVLGTRVPIRRPLPLVDDPTR